MTTFNKGDNPDGGDSDRDSPLTPAEEKALGLAPFGDPLTPDERDILRSFDHSCEENDWSWCYAWHALDSTPTKQQRLTIKGLRMKGLLKLYRGGGMDDDGNIVGGSGYGVTAEGKRALRWTPQRELAL